MPTVLEKACLPAGSFKPGLQVKWDHLTWYRVTWVEVVAGWAFIAMEGHPTSVCSIWHTVELPYRL